MSLAKIRDVLKRDGIFNTIIRGLKDTFFYIHFALVFLFFRILFPFGIKGSQLRRWVPMLTRLPIKKKHFEVTLLHSIDKHQSLPLSLMEIAMASCRAACTETDFSWFNARLSTQVAKDAAIWPGEHYRLLTALVKVTGALEIIEIGTYRGLGALSLVAGLPTGRGLVRTYDILPWNHFDETALKLTDFNTGNLQQIVGDLQNDAFFESQLSYFENTNIIFMDAAKDGCMERKFLKQFRNCKFKKNVLLVIDDIRLWNMLDIWEEIEFPKLDISGFGHYTGTGLVLLPSVN